MIKYKTATIISPSPPILNPPVGLKPPPADEVLLPSSIFELPSLPRHFIIKPPYLIPHDCIFLNSITNKRHKYYTKNHSYNFIVQVIKQKFIKNSFF